MILTLLSILAYIGSRGVYYFSCLFLLYLILLVYMVSSGVMQNLLYVKNVNTPNRFGGINYIGFEKLTFVPIQVC